LVSHSVAVVRYLLTKQDGGGLQALSTLSILSKLCDAIATDKGTDRKPAPCELFDIIGGIGTGGWLALLLGRYCLDLTRCMSIYLELASDPQITAGRSIFGSIPYTLDQKHLIAKIDSILERNGLSPLLLDDKAEYVGEGVEIRCKHAFAVGAIQFPKQGGPNYEIFRSYRTSKTPGPFYHPGPDPGQCKVSSACAATGATKYLLQPYTIGSTTYSDNGFPNPHNITDLALDEAYHLYGEKPPLSVIVNIGPGIPSDHDVEKLQNLSRKFSWPYWFSSSNRTKLSLKSTPNTSPASSSPIDSEWQLTESPSRSDTSSSSGSKAEKVERQIEATIKQRLQMDYKNRKIFMRLAPPPARDELALNDTHVIGASSKAVDEFLEQDTTKERLREAARRYCIASSSA
jgi:hypothetical protein